MTDVAISYIKRAIYRSAAHLKLARLSLQPQRRQTIVDDFHKLFYDSHLIGKTWGSAKFLGVEIQKCPLDLFIYQEIINEVRPSLIIEAGTAFGGGALYLASICELLGTGKVVTIDTLRIPNRPTHKRISYINGSSTNPKTVERVKSFTKKSDKILVILDSNHSRDHVYEELKIYSRFVTKNSYLIVEDSNVNGHPVYPDHGPGPMEAINDFLKINKDFVIDRSREKFYLTFNPRGYLLKIR